jgi:hypothetical protein
MSDTKETDSGNKRASRKAAVKTKRAPNGFSASLWRL